MKKILILVTGCLFFIACNDEKKDENKMDDGNKSTMTSDDKKPASVLLDLSSADPLKKSFAAFARADVDAMTADYDDNVRYTWSNGDSLIGKKAVSDYYKGRWKLIDSVTVSNEIVLPVQVNESQQPAVVPTGKWVLYWAMLSVKYKNGKKINFWMHNTNHMNDAGKIDFVGQYLDRHQIIEATKDLMK